MGRTGAYGYLLYGWESSFRGGASTRDKVFGRGQRITGISRRENIEAIYELYQREPGSAMYKQQEGSLSIEWILANPWFFKGVMGSASTDGAGPYTHTFSKAKDFVSMDIEVGFEAEDANVVRRFKGAVFNSVSITASVNDLIRVRGDIRFFEEPTPTTTLGTAVIDSFEPFSFQHATLQIPNGTTIAEVQSFELTIGNNANPIWGLGSEYAAAAIPRGFDAAGRLNVTMKDASFINLLRDSAASLKLTITNGESGADERTITFNGTDVYFGEHSTALEPNALVIEHLPILIRDLSITAVNNTSTIP